jgi:hypothetical protein
MAFEDPYFGPLAPPDTEVSEDIPPEASPNKSNLSLTIGIVAGSLMLIGFIIGLLAGGSRDKT